MSWLISLLMLVFTITAAATATIAAADPLTNTERNWLQDKGTIIFVSQTNYPPFEFLNKSGNAQGMCIELIQWMAAELGFKATFRDMPFKDAQEAVLSGQADVLTSLFYSKERDNIFDFSEMTWEVPALIFVQAERSDIINLSDLQGKRIAMQQGDYAAEFLKAKGIIYKLIPVDTFAEATDKVLNGDADAVIGDQQIVLYHLFSNNLIQKIKAVGKPLYIGLNGMGVRKGQSELIDILDKGLVLARERGVFERITRKWLGTHYTAPPSWLHRHAHHLAIALVVVLFFAVAIILWSLRLKKLVSRQTRELNEVRDFKQHIIPNAIMKSGLKTWLWVFVILIPLCVGGNYILRNYVILPNYLSLEKQQSQNAVAVCVETVKHELQHLEQITGNWAAWDDTYGFVQDKNSAYAQSNFQWKGLLLSNINLVYIIDNNGKIVWWGVYDPVSNKEIPFETFSKELCSKSHPLLQHKGLDDKVSGIILTTHGPMLTASRPIVTSSGKGPKRGVLIMGRFLTKDMVKELSKQTHTRFNVKNSLTSVLDIQERKLLDNLSPETQVMKTVADNVLMGYGMLADLDGNPALLITAALSRKIVAHGKAMAWVISMVIFAIVVIIGVCLFAWSMSFLTDLLRRQAHIEALVAERTAALQTSETRFRALVDSLPQPIVEVDAQGQLIYLNSVGYQASGYTEEDLKIGLNILDLLIPEHRNKARKDMANLLAGKSIHALEYTILRKDGTTFPSIIYSPSNSHDANLPIFCGIIIDLTEQKRAEEALDAERLRIMSILSVIPGGIYITSQQGDIEYINPVLEQEFGPVNGRKCYDYFHDRTEVCPWCKNEEVFAGKSVQWEWYSFKNDRYYDLFDTPFKNEDGSISKFEYFHDITELKLAEAELRRFMSAINQTGDSIVITTPDGMIQYVNPAFERLTGYTKEEAIGQNPRILQSDEHDIIFYEKMWAALTCGETWRGRIINKSKDGTLFTEDATIAPVVDASDKIVNYVAIKRDITKFLQLEKEKSQLEEQYYQAQKVESIGRLAGGVAHDLNNLLSPILGYGEMLQEDFKPDDTRRHKIDQIVGAGLRARDLVRQLLAFSRKQTLEFKEIEINKTVRDFEKLLRRTIREDVEMELLLSSEFLITKADIGQIEQVLMNLVVNAADAMPTGGRLTIETEQVYLDEEYAKNHVAVEPGSYILLAVSDTGLGMDDKTSKKIFEPFFSTKGEAGTGMGLATVYGIVKQHGGNIWVYSELGKGTIFKIYLPLCEAIHFEKIIDPKEIADLTGHETILLAEDNQQVRELANDILIRQGYTILAAENGKKALEVMYNHEGPLHLLLTDVIMPEMNGKELFALAREHYPDLKALYMSGYTENVIAHRGILDENIEFIQKPFTIDSLVSKVREVMDS